MNIQSIISQEIKNALSIIGISSSLDPLVCPSPKNQPSDYQANGIIKIAKSLKKTPYKLSIQVKKHINLKNICTKIISSKIGFINFYLDKKWLSKNLEIVLSSHRLGVNKQKKQTIIVDYSSPNIAKSMHVGHLRSTIIGDAMVKHLEFLGHNVIRTNHIGDWGTQFGMLIAYFEEQLPFIKEKIFNLNDLEHYYHQAKKKYQKDNLFSEKSRQYVVKLQQGDKYTRALWKKLVHVTIKKNQELYRKLNVSLEPKHIIGESFYNNMLPKIVEDLKQKKIAVTIEGTTIIFLEEFKNRNGSPMGVIIQKKDGGFLYSTIDIACLKYRYQTLHANRILYYTDSRQNQHLQQIWIIGKKAGYIPNDFLLEHHMFGMVLTANKRPFQTRDGNTISLLKLIKESINKATKIIKEKNPNLSTIQIKKLATVIGIGAIKYADLSQMRTNNYIFNWDKMLKFEGNTSLYIQYAYVRIMSIFKKSNISKIKLIKKIFLEDVSEKILAIKILQFEEILIKVAKNGTPHLMCQYLYDISVLFSHFYEKCPILSARNTKLLHSRLNILTLVSKILKKGLNILGIDIINNM